MCIMLTKLVLTCFLLLNLSISFNILIATILAFLIVLQSDKNLLLSPDAEVDSKPALFIYADDVKCVHGATAGNIDKDTLFYLRSRGIDLESASKLLIYGFAREIIDSIEFKPLHELVEKLFLNSIPNYKFEF